MGNSHRYPAKEPFEFTIADWGLAYRKFVESQKRNGLFPGNSEKESNDAGE